MTAHPRRETPTEIIERLSALHPAGYDLALDRVFKLLNKLGDPQLDLPPVIHVAGTNGKGSTIAFMRAILEAGGYHVHTHTSPHLVRYNERFRLARYDGGSADVDDATLAQALLRVERVNNNEDITVFELLTATAFVLFASHPADFTLLEVGLGGRLDATNVIETPLMGVITPISFDHQGYLGDTIEKIAGEKAGIIKPGGHVVVTEQMTDLIIDVIDYAAALEGATLHKSGMDWLCWEERGRLVYQDNNGLLDLPLPKLPGQHQIGNAGAAIAALKAADIDLLNEHIEMGLQNASWPGRLQKLKTGPIVDACVDGSEIWLDGGHNPAAGEVLASVMADLEEKVPRPLFLVTGMLNTKDPVGYFEPFADLARHCFTVPLQNTPNAVPPEDLAQMALEGGVSAEPVESVEKALSLLKKSWKFERPPRVLIGGSLYLVGEMLEVMEH